MDKPSNNEEDINNVEEAPRIGELPTQPNKLKTIRGLRKWKQEQMAEFLDISVSTIKNIEAGKDQRETTRIWIAKKLHLRQEDIWTDIKKEQEEQKTHEPLEKESIPKDDPVSITPQISELGISTITSTPTETAIASTDEQNTPLPNSVHIPTTPGQVTPQPFITQPIDRYDRRQFMKIGVGIGTAGLILIGGYTAYQSYLHKGLLFPNATPISNIPSRELGQWQHTGSMARRRTSHSATRLLDGTVLVAGGRSDGDTLVDITETYDPVSGSWQTKDSLNQPRLASNSLVTLQNGNALIVGGVDATQNLGLHDDFSSAELYNPDTGTWSFTDSLGTPRRSTTVTLFQDGQRVLVAGGAKGLPDPNQFVGTTELYDLHTGVWMYVGNLNVARQNANTVLLRDGRVMLAGGEGPESVLGPTIELFDPRTEKWSEGSPMPWGRTSATLTVLKEPDERVLVLGGSNSINKKVTNYASAALYDPKKDRWMSIRPMSTPRSGHTASLLPNGDVLVVGGAGKDAPSCEVYDPTHNIWSPVPSMIEPRSGHMAVTLNNGDILVIGGVSTSTGAYLDTCERFQISND